MKEKSVDLFHRELSDKFPTLSEPLNFLNKIILTDPLLCWSNIFLKPGLLSLTDSWATFFMQAMQKQIRTQRYFFCFDVGDLEMCETVKIECQTRQRDLRQ